MEGGQNIKKNPGFFSGLWQAITHSVKTAYTSVKEFFTATASQKDKTAIQSSDLSGQILKAVENAITNKDAQQERPPATQNTSVESTQTNKIQQNKETSSPTLPQTQSQTQQVETTTVRVKKITCDKRPVDVPPPNFKYPGVSAVNIMWTEVNPFIELEWGSG